MVNRRTLLKSIALGSATLPFSGIEVIAKPKEETKFLFSLNTSTIKGQKLDLPQTIELAARAGYDGFEPWMSEIQTYLETGKSLASLKKLAADAGLEFFDCIGFPTWMSQDPEKSKAGFVQMEKEMEVLAELGCPRVAAPAIGTKAPLDLLAAGEKYKRLLELGRKTGVMPQLEFWGAYPSFYHLGQAMMVAAAADDKDAKILADVYHLFRGGSGFEGMKMLDGHTIDIFHMNDIPLNIPQLEQQDKDRVMPGDGAAPMKEIAETLKSKGGQIILSLELFNPTYYAMDPEFVITMGLEKMKQFF
jgi:sugar phosphate isomerase/epimerase